METLVSVVVPAYNEAATLEELFKRVNAVFTGLQRPFEFIVVDDGSQDDTRQVISRLQAEHDEVVLIRHRRNHGKSISLMQGFDAAKGEMVITMDADLQDLPEEIPAFLNKIGEGYDLVNGWRHNRQDSLAKRLVSEMFNGVTNLLLERPLHDINCGFKVIRRNALEGVTLRGDMHRLLPAMVESMGGLITEIPIAHSPRQHGRSAYPLLRYRGILDVLSYVTVQATNIRPFHSCFELSLVFWLVAISSLLVRFSWTAAHETWSQVLLVVVSLSSLIAVVLPFFGLMLEVMANMVQTPTWRRGLARRVTRWGEEEHL